MEERTGTQAAKMATRKAISKNAWQRAVRVNPKTLILRGTRNAAVVDASLIPTIVPAHPVGTLELKVRFVPTARRKTCDRKPEVFGAARRRVRPLRPQRYGDSPGSATV